jgi:hypothetical protein
MVHPPLGMASSTWLATACMQTQALGLQNSTDIGVGIRLLHSLQLPMYNNTWLGMCCHISYCSGREWCCGNILSVGKAKSPASKHAEKLLQGINFLIRTATELLESESPQSVSVNFRAWDLGHRTIDFAFRRQRKWDRCGTQRDFRHSDEAGRHKSFVISWHAAN